MANIFISYRRADTLSQAGRLHQMLEVHFGKGAAFYDNSELKPGMNWPEELKEKIENAKVVLVLYGGKEWLGIDNWGDRRMDNPNDWVRKEVEAALENAELVIPVVFRGAPFPPRNVLPETIHPLLDKQMWDIAEARFDIDVQPLLTEIEKILPRSGEAPLKQEAPDPLAHLPLPDHMVPPLVPFKGLSWFQEEDARIFFGREQEISKLYDKLTNPYSDLTLFYGQSGAGKSSLLHAGLLPRLKPNWQVSYFRLDQDGSIREIFARFIDEVEKNKSPKALLILDQLEEVYQQSVSLGETELVTLVDSLRILRKNDWQEGEGDEWHGPDELRIIFSFREEYLARFSEAFKKENIPFLEHYLQNMKEEELARAVNGITTDPNLVDYYRGFSISGAGLPEYIAKDILENEADNPAPLLQFILRRMWDVAAAQPAVEPVFTWELYRKARKQSLPELLEGELEEIRKTEFGAAIENGLVLDVLNGFVTEDDTASAVSEQTLEIDYGHLSGPIRELCVCLVDHYLLTSYQDEGGRRFFRLCHDALASIVRKRFSISEAPGQRANRILENARLTGSMLNKQGLLSVEAGMDGRRALTGAEAGLVEKSRGKHLKSLIKDRIGENRIEEVLEMLKSHFLRKKGRHGLAEVIKCAGAFNQIQVFVHSGYLHLEEEFEKKNEVKEWLFSLVDIVSASEKKEVQQKVLELIRLGELQNALNELMAFCEEEGSAEMVKDIKLIYAQFFELQIKLKTGLISYESYSEQLDGVYQKTLAFTRSQMKVDMETMEWEEAGEGFSEEQLSYLTLLEKGKTNQFFDHYVSGILEEIQALSPEERSCLSQLLSTFDWGYYSRALTFQAYFEQKKQVSDHLMRAVLTEGKKEPDAAGLERSLRELIADLEASKQKITQLNRANALQSMKKHYEEANETETVQSLREAEAGNRDPVALLTELTGRYLAGQPGPETAPADIPGKAELKRKISQLIRSADYIACCRLLWERNRLYPSPDLPSYLNYLVAAWMDYERNTNHSTAPPEEAMISLNLMLGALLFVVDNVVFPGLD